ncbi:MAG: IreB family regulatory phosphoprotein [Oscillospiraceae bacterium]|jgi:uncharacterized protein (UPF0297 family)|nr:IreB family regulatory phosphoprotein [Oscillospiraceae bacterium]
MSEKNTITFSVGDGNEETIREVLKYIYDALEEKGYDSIGQIVGFVLSEDPTYITTHKNARNLATKLDRSKVMRALVKNYIEKKPCN